MDHTPMVPADDRALRLLERADVAPGLRQRLIGVVQAAQESADAAGVELQAEFGREHVGLIVGCNQFVRLWRSGAEPGAVEILLDPADRQELAEAGFALRAPDGMVFKLFGWVRLDPEAGREVALRDAVAKAFAKAKAAKKPA